MHTLVLMTAQWAYACENCDEYAVWIFGSHSMQMRLNLDRKKQNKTRIENKKTIVNVECREYLAYKA